MMDLLSLRQAARELHISERTVRGAVRSGELPAFQLAKRTLRVDRADLQQWVREKRISTWRSGPR
jgi:excisionase family DNA binding protein